MEQKWEKDASPYLFRHQKVKKVLGILGKSKGGIFTFRYSIIYNMKKLILSIFVAIAAMMSASAQYASAPEVFANNPDQVVPGLKYR